MEEEERAEGDKLSILSIKGRKEGIKGMRSTFFRHKHTSTHILERLTWDHLIDLPALTHPHERNARGAQPSAASSAPAANEPLAFPYLL